MSAKRIAGRYAKSLIDLAKEKGKLKEVYADMTLLDESIAGSKELRLMLKSPIISTDKKESIINSIFGNKLSDISNLFINLLIKKGRESYLADIADAAIERYNKMHNIAKAKLTTAIEVDVKIANEVKAILTKIAGTSDVQIEKAINPDLIGGFILQYGDKLIDNSIQRKLQLIKKEIQDTTYINKI